MKEISLAILSVCDTRKWRLTTYSPFAMASATCINLALGGNDWKTWFIANALIPLWSCSKLKDDFLLVSEAKDPAHFGAGGADVAVVVIFSVVFNEFDLKLSDWKRPEFLHFIHLALCSSHMCNTASRWSITPIIFMPSSDSHLRVRTIKTCASAQTRRTRLTRPTISKPSYDSTWEFTQ